MSHVESDFFCFFSFIYLNWKLQAQDPTAFGDEFADDARKVLQTRYRLLPYLYTLFYRAKMDGSTVVRSLMHE